jgi:hypothetical protein
MTWFSGHSRNPICRRCVLCTIIVTVVTIGHEAHEGTQSSRRLTHFVTKIESYLIRSLSTFLSLVMYKVF